MYIVRQRRGEKKSFYAPNALELSPFPLRRVPVFFNRLSSFSRCSQPLFGKNKANLHHNVVFFLLCGFNLETTGEPRQGPLTQLCFYFSTTV